MSETQNGFATAIACMDGRIQLPLLYYIQEKAGVAYTDMITEPGAIKLVADAPNPHILQVFKKKVEISIEAHQSKSLFVAAHAQCAANPIADELQQVQIRKAVEKLKSLFPAMPIVGLWVNHEWKVEDLTSGKL